MRRVLHVSTRRQHRTGPVAHDVQVARFLHVPAKSMILANQRRSTCAGSTGPDLSSMTCESLGRIYKEMVSQVAIQMVAANSSFSAANQSGCARNSARCPRLRCRLLAAAPDQSDRDSDASQRSLDRRLQYATSHAI
jgi:hypothetical protein